MSDGGIAAFLACLLLCPTEGQPLSWGEPLPTLRDTPYDCRQARPGELTWVGNLTGHNNNGMATQAIAVRGCFDTRTECERVLDRFDGLTFGRVYRRCVQRLPPT